MISGSDILVRDGISIKKLNWSTVNFSKKKPNTLDCQAGRIAVQKSYSAVFFSLSKCHKFLSTT